MRQRIFGVFISFLVLLSAGFLYPFEAHGVAVESCTPPPSGMVSWWGGDNNALDMVGGNNGTRVNGAQVAETDEKNNRAVARVH